MSYYEKLIERQNETGKSPTKKYHKGYKNKKHKGQCGNGRPKCRLAKRK